MFGDEDFFVLTCQTLYSSAVTTPNNIFKYMYPLSSVHSQ